MSTSGEELLEDFEVAIAGHRKCLQPMPWMILNEVYVTVDPPATADEEIFESCLFDLSVVFLRSSDSFDAHLAINTCVSFL